MSIPGGVLLAQRSGKGLGTVPKFPVITGSATVSINENTTAVATYTADEAVTWSLAGTDAARFQINSSGVLSFVTAPDFEAPADADADNIYLVTVRAMNASEGNMSTLPVIVTVQNVAVENPIITGSTTVSAAENQTAVASYTADRTVTWSISGGADSAKFQINSSGVLTFITAPDFEAPGDANGDNVYQVTIAATDTNSLVGTLTVLVTVTDAVDPLYVEDVFSTYLYTGTGGAQTITNGVDLAGNGGMVWVKSRAGAAYAHHVHDTNRGTGFQLFPSSTSPEFYDSTGLNAFNSNGFGLSSSVYMNGSGVTFASWTFRQAPKFFDVVTWSGNSNFGRSIPHNLGITPGCIIVKNTTTGTSWAVWHNSMNVGSGIGNAYMWLNQGQPAFADDGGLWGNGSAYIAPTSTNFTVSGGSEVNASGSNYVAYIFAHDPSSDGIIQCGSYTGNGGSQSISLGWEAQWLLIKKATNNNGTSRSWVLVDNMRSLPAPGGPLYASLLVPNLSNTESVNTQGIGATATGFGLTVGDNYNGSGESYIYVAIRRGPMRTPTSGASVFKPVVRTGTGGNATVTSVGFPPDAVMSRSRNNGTGISAFGNMTVFDRMRGVATTGTITPYLFTSSTQPENTIVNGISNFSMNGYSLGTDGNIGTSNYSVDENYINYSFRRARSFFDVVCWTNTGVTQNVSHGLGVVPELIITKRRTADEGWQIYSAPTGASAYLNFGNLAVVTGNTSRWNATSPTSTTFTTGSAFNTAENYVAYLFASCPGVSKVGSYTGNGSTQTINCGFTNGARFVLIKRVDNSGSWFVWDTARGITSGNDPFVRLDSSSIEGGDSYNSIDPSSNGFIVIQSDAAQINVSGATYIYLAIA